MRAILHPATTNLYLLVYSRLMDESLRWLFANGKNKQAARVIERAAKMNGVPVEKVMMVSLPLISQFIKLS